MSTFGYGLQTPYDTTSPLNEVSFVIRQAMARLNVMVPVKVLAVNAIQGLVAGTVDVQPLVSQIDGNNNVQPHGTVSGILYLRLQGGPNAIICDPVVGDVGFVVVGNRDATNIKRGQSTTVSPGSFRRNDLQDGIYVGGVLNPGPTQYLQFLTNGGLNLIDQFNNSLVFASGGISLKDKFNNLLSFASGGFTLQDNAGNKFISSASNSNLVLSDTHGNVLDFTASGIGGNSWVGPNVYANGSSATYTTPTSPVTGALPTYLMVEAVGGGGGGAGSGTGATAGGNGGNTTFAGITAGGGSGGGVISTGAGGGSASGGHINVNGGQGGGSQLFSTTNSNNVNSLGGHGGVSFYGGGAGSTASGNNGNNGSAFGSGAAGAAGATSSDWSGAGGGAGAYARLYITQSSIAASYNFTVGAGGGGGSAGTGGEAGGTGQIGVVMVAAFFQ